LLTELDGLEALKEIVVIAATNRPDMIDPALLRAGRFDRLVLVGQSTREGRRNIFQIHTRDIPLSSNVSIDELADITEGYVGADIEAVCREAVMLALRENFSVEKIDMKHFREALNKVRPTLSENLMGYYKKIHELFKGGMPKEETSSYIGYR
jgi:transitional endoplasmic reticulum ATPase